MHHDHNPAVTTAPSNITITPDWPRPFALLTEHAFTLLTEHADGAAVSAVLALALSLRSVSSTTTRLLVLVPPALRTASHTQ